MIATRSIAKLFCFLGSTLLLCQCSKTVEPEVISKKQVVASSPFSMPANAYLALANNQSGEERQSMLIMAAGRFLYDNQWQEALDILTQTSTESLLQMDEKNILMARIESMRDQPRAAITALSSVHHLKDLPQYYQSQYHDILASAYEAAGNASYAISERIKADPLLADDASRDNNRRNLWLTMSKLPEPELTTLAAEAAEGSSLQAWLELALIPRKTRSDEKAMLAQVEQWQQRYPNHPGNSLLPQPLSAVKPWLHGAPERLALLVPLSGPLAGPGGAVRDGFMAAWREGHSDHDVHVNIYDTAKGDVATLYEQALTEGAEYVVGPLTKNDAAKIAVLEHPVPTLMLNEVDAKGSDNIWQFGLSPANEARQVAVKAHKSGKKKAIIISPAGAWGEEIVAAFSKQWQSSGGTITDQLAYDNSTDLTKAVATVLHVSEKDANARPVKGQLIEQSAKRRQDFDMIFLVAYPTRARQIVPLLKYYFAGDVPVFATSLVYSGYTNTMRDRDLDGLIFCDMPWVFNHQLASKNWPEQLNSYSRLYALGMDSYSLATQLNQLMLFPALGVNDKSGILYLNRARQIARIPAWGKFKNGVAVRVNAPAEDV